MVRVTCGTDVACESCPMNLLEGEYRDPAVQATRDLTERGLRIVERGIVVEALLNQGVSEDNEHFKEMFRATSSSVIVAASVICRTRFVD